MKINSKIIPAINETNFRLQVFNETTYCIESFECKLEIKEIKRQTSLGSFSDFVETGLSTPTYERYLSGRLEIFSAKQPYILDKLHLIFVSDSNLLTLDIYKAVRYAERATTSKMLHLYALNIRGIHYVPI